MKKTIMVIGLSVLVGGVLLYLHHQHKPSLESIDRIAGTVTYSVGGNKTTLKVSPGMTVIDKELALVSTFDANKKLVSVILQKNGKEIDKL